MFNSTLTDQIYAVLPKMKELDDPRTQQWLLVDSPWHVFSLVAIYLLLVRFLPKWMASRKPYKLNDLLLLYNLSMAVLNAYICKETVTAAYTYGYSFWCQPCRYDRNAMEIKLASAVWWFFFSKLLEFGDTIFFILRKKSSQLTFLHVYHHSTMFPLQWLVVKWVPGGSTFFGCMLNSFVHVIMYSYYGLSSFGPSMRKYLWWKRYLTALQLLQFTLGIIYSMQSIVRGCDFPAWIHVLCICYAISFLFLFGNFYVKAYSKKSVKAS